MKSGIFNYEGSVFYSVDGEDRREIVFSIPFLMRMRG